jgi:hypothetical protein
MTDGPPRDTLEEAVHAWNERAMILLDCEGSIGKSHSCSRHDCLKTPVLVIRLHTPERPAFFSFCKEHLAIGMKLVGVIIRESGWEGIQKAYAEEPVA